MPARRIQALMYIVRLTICVARAVLGSRRPFLRSASGSQTRAPKLYGRLRYVTALGTRLDGTADRFGGNECADLTRPQSWHARFGRTLAPGREPLIASFALRITAP